MTSLNELMEGPDQLEKRFSVEFDLGRQILVAKQGSVRGEDIEIGQAGWKRLSGICQKVHQQAEVMGSGIADASVEKQSLEKFFHGLLAMKPEDFITYTVG
nr:hypothetical protein [Geobacter sp.]